MICFIFVCKFSGKMAHSRNTNVSKNSKNVPIFPLFLYFTHQLLISFSF